MTDFTERLWSTDTPDASGTDAIDVPVLSVHTNVTGTDTRTGMIICPGGGYRILASTHEGLNVAHALNQFGIKAFVLRYRLGPKYHSTTSLLDGQRAIRYVRHHATRFGIDPDRLGMLGFSAGGHLTLATGTSEASGDASNPDPIEQESALPNFLVPVYAVSNGIVRGRKASEYLPTDTQVSASTPPTFIVHTHEDKIVPANQATLIYDALLEAGIQAELHIFGFGEHGVGLASGDPDTREWLPLLHRWLKRIGMLTHRNRVAIDQEFAWTDNLGQPLSMYWITLVPDDPNAPTARVRLDPNANHQIKIPASHGPIPGTHTLELRRISHTWPYETTGEYHEFDRTNERVLEQPTLSMKVEVSSDGTIRESDD